MSSEGCEGDLKVKVGLQHESVISPLLFAVVSSEPRSGLRSELLYTSDSVLMTPKMEQPDRRVAKWRVNILDKGLKVNSGMSRVMVDSSCGKMIVNFGKWPCCLVVFFLDLWEERGVTPISSYLGNCQFHHTPLESLKHLIFVSFYIILVF